MSRDLLSGFSITELVVLSLLHERDMIGLEVVKEVSDCISAGRIYPGIVYPLLKDCVKVGWISAKIERNRRSSRIVRYSLTPLGRERLRSIAANWHDVNKSVVRLLSRVSKTAETTHGFALSTPPISKTGAGASRA
jgi:PadR family transcriptional regulator, regulatory protein PadR